MTTMTVTVTTAGEISDIVLDVVFERQSFLPAARPRRTDTVGGIGGGGVTFLF